MSKASFGSKYWHFHILALVVYLIVCGVYLAPIFSGLKLYQSDEELVRGLRQEMEASWEEFGEDPLWINSCFSGMPELYALVRTGNAFQRFDVFMNEFFPGQTLWWMLVMCIGMYVCMIAFEVHPILAIGGGLAYAFASVNVIGVEVGHGAKILAMGYMPGIVGGAYMVFRGKLIPGLLVTGIFTALQLSLAHIQITYYTLLVLVFLGLFELGTAARNGALPEFAKRTGLLLAVALLALSVNAGRLMSVMSYSPESTRGGSVLSQDDEQSNIHPLTVEGGLDWPYATGWSYGKMESFNMIIPGFTGGSTSEKLPEEGSALGQYGFTNAFTYWGDMSFTEGPTYIGATVFFLFVLAFFFVDGHLRWWVLATGIFTLMLSWGGNFESFYHPMYKHLPMLKKFRTPNMILAVIEMLVPLLALVGLSRMMAKSQPMQDLQKKVLMAGGIALGVVILVGYVMAGGYDYSHPNDANRFQQIGGLKDQIASNPALLDRLIGDLKSDRQAMLTSDTNRSLMFMLLMIGLVMAWVRGFIKPWMLAVGTVLLIFVDLYGVDQRYLNHEQFTQKQDDRMPPPSQADLAIQADNQRDGDLDYRVLNVSGYFGGQGDPFRESITSVHHNSVGGYSAIKLRRYQDMIERGISPQMFPLLSQVNSPSAVQDMLANAHILNMCNAKYLLIQPDQGYFIKNPHAFGPAWFVNDVQFVADADAEMAATVATNTRNTAIVTEDQRSMLDGYNPGTLDTASTIDLTFKKFRELIYSANVSGDQPQLAVFSEMYYRGDDDWQITIDGEPAEMFRVDYLLRGMLLPPGQHEIKFEFVPSAYFTGRRISMASSVLCLLLIGFGVFLWRKEGGLEAEIPAFAGADVAKAKPTVKKAAPVKKAQGKSKGKK